MKLHCIVNDVTRKYSFAYVLPLNLCLFISTEQIMLKENRIYFL